MVDLRRSDFVHCRGRGVLCPSRRISSNRRYRVAVWALCRSSTIGTHLSLLSGLLPGGVLQLVTDQVTLISRQANETLSVAFLTGLMIALGSANSGMAALFDALNVVYNEREKRSLVRFYATTLLFTFAGIAFVIVAITGVVLVP